VRLARTSICHHLVVSNSTPRDALLDPKEFGRSPEVKLLDPTSRSGRIAHLQSQFAFAARVALKNRRTTMIAFASHVGMKPARLGRLLRGTTPMKLEDIATIANALNLTVDLVAEEQPGQPISPASLAWLKRHPQLLRALRIEPGRTRR